MNGLVVCIIIFAVLFATLYVTKRRFGVLGLALAAGFVLSDIWQTEGALLANFLGIPMGMITTMVVSVTITLLPSVVLLFCGNKYNKIYSRLFGAILFSLLGLAFVISPISKAMTVQGFGADFYNFFIDNRQMMIGIGIVAAVIDIIFTKKTVVISNKKHSH